MVAIYQCLYQLIPSLYLHIAIVHFPPAICPLQAGDMAIIQCAAQQCDECCAQQWQTPNLYQT